MRNLSLRVKLIGGFLMVCFITMIIGFSGWLTANRLTHHILKIGNSDLVSVQSLLTLKESAESIRVITRTLLNSGLDLAQRHEQIEKIATIKAYYETEWANYEALPKTPKETELWKKFKTSWKDLEATNNLFFKYCKELEDTDILDPTQFHAKIEKYRSDHYNLLFQVSRFIENGEEFKGGDDYASCEFGKWIKDLQTKNPIIEKTIKKIDVSHQNFHAAVKTVKKHMKSGIPELARIELQDNLVPLSLELTKGFATVLAEVDKAESIYFKMNRIAMDEVSKKQDAVFLLLENLSELAKNSTKQSISAANQDSKISKFVSFFGMTIGFVFSLSIGILLSFRIIKTLKNTINGISDSSEQLSAASSQVSSSSQLFAQGSSDQAASIQETSSTLEEISSMTKQNASYSNEADGLMKNGTQIVHKANDSMARLTTSMQDIADASQETSKIIKTIDEIAFQTNLLALNAAVEAARAGEAGAGFAVVADEVRNLAMRAADAAKNTSVLIEGTVIKIKDGVGLVEETNNFFKQVEESVGRVGQLVEEIAAASHEQSQGIDEINISVTDMNSVVQQNAANAEENASASEELSAQAESLQAYVKDLLTLIEGSNTTTANIQNNSAYTTALNHSLEASDYQSKTGFKPKAGAKNPPVKEITPEQVIPLEDDFSEF